MKSMRQLLVLIAIVVSPTAAFGDLVKGIIDGVYDNSYVAGWVCDRGSTDSLNFDVYVGGPIGSSGTTGLSPRGLASNRNEASVDTECGHAGTSGNHRYIYAFTEAQKQAHQGKPIYIYGIRGGLENRVLVNSGRHNVPAPSVAAGPGPSPTPTPDPEPIDDITSGAWSYGANVTITSIILWQESEVNPLYFKRSDNVLCYVPAGEPTLQSLILTLYSSGNTADIHCHAEPEELMLGVRAAHKLHRVVAK